MSISPLNPEKNVVIIRRGPVEGYGGGPFVVIHWDKLGPANFTSVETYEQALNRAKIYMIGGAKLIDHVGTSDDGN